MARHVTCPVCESVWRIHVEHPNPKVRCLACGAKFRADSGEVLEGPVRSRDKKEVAGACPVCGEEYAFRSSVTEVKVRCRRCRTTFVAGSHKVLVRGEVPAEPPEAPVIPASPSAAAHRPAQPSSAEEPARPADAATAAPAGERQPEAAGPRPSEERAPAPEPAPEAEEGYPWEVPPALVEKADRYDEERAFTACPCKVNEFLNRPLKNEAVRQLVDAELRVYPDMVGVDLRRAPGWLMKLVMMLPAWLSVPLGLALSAPNACLTVLFLPFSLLLAVPFTIVMLPVELIQRLFLPRVARRIRANPGSSYAIKKLFKL
ncbi:MAG: hypothetical protein ACODAJ_08625, partial [Planctomycetota bacterium]